MYTILAYNQINVDILSSFVYNNSIKVVIEVGNTEFATALRQRRKSRGLSQQELADMLRVTKGAVAFWEDGSRVPRIDKLKALENLLGLNCSNLYTKNPEEDTTSSSDDDRKIAIQKEEARLTTYALKYAKLGRWAQEAVEGLVKALEAECELRGELLSDNCLHCDIRLTVEGQEKLFPNDKSEK